jgi:hypothetical protein
MTRCSDAQHLKIRLSVTRNGGCLDEAEMTKVASLENTAKERSARDFANSSSIAW